MTVDHGDARRRSSPSGGSAAPRRRASPASWRRSACCTATSSTEGVRPDDPTAELDGVRVPAGLPKPLTRGRGDVPARRRRRQRPGRPPRPCAARAAVRHRRPDLRGRAGCRCGDIDFDGRLVRLFGKGSKERIVPFGRAAAAALDEWFSPRGRVPLVPAQWRRRDDAEAVFLNRARRPPDPAGGVGGGQRYGDRAGLRRRSCRRTCCATRAPRTCSTTAPTCGSCRRCSATPRSRRRRCTRRSARSGCGRSTGPPTPRRRCVR